MGRALGIRARADAGFTLVEVLVVMLIVALLAVIAIPAFFSQRDKARDAEAKAQVTTARTAMEIFATDHDGGYMGASPATLEQIEPSLRDVPSGDLTVQVMGASGQYEVAVLAGTGTEFSIRRDNKDSIEFRCDDPGVGGCPSSGLWG